MSGTRQLPICFACGLWKIPGRQQVVGFVLGGCRESGQSVHTQGLQGGDQGGSNHTKPPGAGCVGPQEGTLSLIS